MNKTPPLFQLRIKHLLYAIALYAAALATFGAAGLILWMFVLGVWAYIFFSKDRERGCVHVGFVLSGVALVILLWPAFPSAGEAALRSQCADNLKQLALALQNYHLLYGSFPPAYVPDETGKPMHSWRVLVLPFLENQSLFDKYNFDEPWDGPNNRKLLGQMPDIFECPIRVQSSWQRKGYQYHTSYMAVVGAQAAWVGGDARKLSELGDPSQVVLLIEADPEGVPWMAPRDVDVTRAMALLCGAASPGGHAESNFFYTTCSGRNVAFADTQVRFVNHWSSPDVLRSLLVVGHAKATVQSRAVRTDQLSMERRWHVANCYRLVIFLTIVVLPFPWLFKRPATGPTPRKGANSGRGK